MMFNFRERFMINGRLWLFVVFLCFRENKKNIFDEIIKWYVY